MCETVSAMRGETMTEPIHWLSTKEAAERLGVTLRSLYRFIDEGDLVAYKFGRVIRIQEPDVDRFIQASRIAPGSLEHLYPEVKGAVRVVPTNGISAAGA
jgi:excisionase family DNA binding protein